MAAQKRSVDGFIAAQCSHLPCRQRGTRRLTQGPKPAEHQSSGSLTRQSREERSSHQYLLKGEKKIGARTPVLYCSGADAVTHGF